jgi:hypothetical protein
MSYFAYDRMGNATRRPDLQKMAELLESVLANDPEHPDVSLTNEDGWALSYFGSRTMIFENVETGDGPWHSKGVSQEQALDLWTLLSQGRLDEIRAAEWHDGYGS